MATLYMVEVTRPIDIPTGDSSDTAFEPYGGIGVYVEDTQSGITGTPSWGGAYFNRET